MGRSILGKNFWKSWINKFVNLILQECCKDVLLDRLRLVLEVCNADRLGPFLSLYRQRRLNSEDVQVAEGAWKVSLPLQSDVSSCASIS